MAKSSDIVTNGSNDLRCFRPLAQRVRRVINKLVNEIVVLTPAKITAKIAMSWLPTPVYFVFDENGVINAQPESVNVRFEHLVK
jgi:hypothetical protein